MAESGYSTQPPLASRLCWKAKQAALTALRAADRRLKADTAARRAARLARPRQGRAAWTPCKAAVQASAGMLACTTPSDNARLYVWQQALRPGLSTCLEGWQVFYCAQSLTCVEVVQTSPR